MQPRLERVATRSFFVSFFFSFFVSFFVVVVIVAIVDFVCYFEMWGFENIFRTNKSYKNNRDRGVKTCIFFRKDTKKNHFLKVQPALLFFN